MEQVWYDVKNAGRGLWRSPGFTVTAVLTLAIGMAGSIAMFAVVYGVLLRPLPVQDQTRLLVAWKALPLSGYSHYPFGGAEIDQVAGSTRLLEKVAGVTANGVGRSVMRQDATSDYVNVALVTGTFFEVLGVRPQLGRPLAESDDVPGRESVLVISHGLWVRRFGRSAAIVGTRVRVDDRPFTIVGVMPADLDYPRGTDAWRAVRSVPIDGPFGDAAREEVDLLARLRPGVTREQARSELQALTRQFESTAPATTPRGLVAVVRSFEEEVVGDVRVTVVALFVSVLLVALIASANVASLLLVRGEARASETALRAALGADRSRIVREVFAESLLVALAAGALALILVRGTLHSAIALIPDSLPRTASIRIDGTVLLFSLVAAFGTAMLAGLAPAWSSTRAGLVSVLRHGSSGGAAARRLRGVLVATQIALAVTTLSAAGLLIRSLLQLQSVDTGFAAERLVLVDLALPEAKYADRSRHARFLDAVTSRFAAVPAIASATPVTVPPFSGEAGWDLPKFTAEGQSTDRAARNAALNLESVHPGYFQTFGITLVRGRGFARSDSAAAPPVAIVSGDVAAQTWPGEDPVGKRLKMGDPDAAGPWLTVVGVAAPTRYRDLTVARPTLYLPAAQFQTTARMIALRTSASSNLVASIAPGIVGTIDPDVHVVRVTSFVQLLRRPLAQPRFNTLVLAIFGAAALLLAGVGVYGLVAASVRRRNREIAIRLALGATSAIVQRMIVGDMLRLGTYGVAIGLAGALLSTRMLRGMLFGVQPFDPAALGAAAALLLLISAMAAFPPVWRATRQSTAAALRAE